VIQNLEILELARRNTSALCILRILPGLTALELADEIGKRSSTFSTDPSRRAEQVRLSLSDLLKRQPPRVQFNQKKGEAGRWFPSEH
jgi:hypothetical protein